MNQLVGILMDDSIVLMLYVLRLGELLGLILDLVLGLVLDLDRLLFGKFLLLDSDGILEFVSQDYSSEISGCIEDFGQLCSGNNKFFFSLFVHLLDFYQLLVFDFQVCDLLIA